MKNVLVTGGTGLLGNNIVRELLNQNFNVTVAVRASSDKKPFEGLDVTRVEVDFHNARSVAGSLHNIDTVIHSAGFIWFGWRKLEQSRQVNVGITELLAKQCLEKQIRLVHISSLDALPVGLNGEVMDEESPGSPKVQCNYVVSKIEADAVVKSLFAEGLSGCIVHPGLMFGPHDWKPSSGELIQTIAKMGIWFSVPTGGISVADVRDVASGAIAAAEKGQTGRQYILGGENISYKNLCRIIAEKCGVWTPRGRTGPAAYLVAALVGGINGLFGRETMINTAAIGMARHWHFYSSERAQSELGYTVRDLNQSLDDEIDWLIENNMIHIRK